MCVCGVSSECGEEWGGGGEVGSMCGDITVTPSAKYM